MFYTATGTAPLPVSSQVVVLYDRKSGAIAHMHQALFFSTSRPPQEKERLLTELVKRLAKEINPTLDLQAYEVLHAPDFELGQAEYTVDVGRKQLTEIR
jgi:hypothetical protein